MAIFARQRRRRKCAPRFTDLVVETLELRTLLALPAQLVADINTFPVGASVVGPIVQVGSVDYFAGSDSLHGIELWKTDGTPNGTGLVKDILAGRTSGYPYPGGLTNVNGTLYFSANDGVHGTELWQSDSTATGTVMLIDIRPGSSSSQVRYLANVNGTLFFEANDGVNGYALWKSDGTASGTVLLTNFGTVTNRPEPTNFTTVGGTNYFTANDATHGRELWKTNGTATGTVLVRDVRPGSPSSGLQSLVNVNGNLFFSANDGTNGYELWKSDGTATGTVLVTDTNSGSGSSTPKYLTNLSGSLFFSANDGTHGTQLWKSDGTAAGTSVVKDVRVGASSLGYSSAVFMTLNGTLLFTANDGTTGSELWKSDGTTGGTSLLKDLIPGATSSDPRQATIVNGKVFFTAGTQLWQSDGTSGGTVLVKSSYAPINVSYLLNLTNVGGSLVFRTISGQTPGPTVLGTLWKSDGTDAGTTVIPAAGSSNDSSYPDHFTTVNGIDYFIADDGLHGWELWKTDGTTAGTVLVKDINPGPQSSSPHYFVNLNGILIFSADSGSGSKLWKSDGTAAGTTLAKDMIAVQKLAVLSGKALFVGQDIGSGGIFNPTALWSTDGTADGTVPLKAIQLRTYFNHFAVVNGSVYFSARKSSSDKYQLWKSDGTADGTVLVSSTAGQAIEPDNLVNVNGTLFFSAQDNYNQNRELWKSDGTSAGTVMVKDIGPGYLSSIPVNLTNFNGTLMFAARNGYEYRGYELWRSDGTADGTTLVKDTRQGADYSGPTYLTVIGDSLYFAAYSSVGASLWKSDGTTAGTVELRQFNPSSYADRTATLPGNLANIGGTLIFSANDGTNGYELWQSDGTPAGTTQASDILPGPQSSYPYNFNLASGRLIFEANDGMHGTELWAAAFSTTNHPPTAANYTYKFRLNTPLVVPSVGVISNSFDVDNDKLTASLVSAAAHGIVVLNTDGGFNYTPDTDYVGPDSFTYTLSDGQATSPTAGTVSITVLPANQPPSGASKTVVTNEDTSYTFFAGDFGFNDASDLGLNNFLAVKITTTPASGALTNGGSPVAAGQFISVVDLANGKLVFTPPINGNGTAFTNFTFQVQDDGGTANGGIDLDPMPRTLTMTVAPINDPPQGHFQVLTVLAGTPRTFSVADFPFSDPLDNPPDSLQSVKLWSVPTVGTLRYNGSPATIFTAVSATDLALGKLVYLPPAAANAATQFFFQLQDSGGTASGGIDRDPVQRVMTLVVNPQANTPPTGQDRTITTDENLSYLFSLDDFAFTDAAPVVANNLLAVEVVTAPAVGTLKRGSTTITPGQFIPAADIAAGRIAYYPPSDTDGVPLTSFTFQLQDDGGTAGGGVDLDPAGRTITINVKHTNQPPLVVDQSFTTEQSTKLTVGGDGGLGQGLLITASDPDDSRASLRIISGPVHGILHSYSGGAVEYTPNRGFIGADSFTYQADDGNPLNNLSNIGTVTITVTNVNHPPIARDDSLIVRQNTANNPSYLGTWGVIYNDSDIDGDETNHLSAILVTPPAHGSVILNPNGVFTYTPAAGYLGPDSFTYQGDDGHAQNHLSNIATVTLKVSGANSPPQDQIVTNIESVTMGFGRPFAIPYPGILANDYSTNGNTIWFSSGTVPDQATLKALYVQTDGSFAFTPAATFVGQTYLNYILTDGEGAFSSYGELNIRVTAEGDHRPIAIDDNYAIRPLKPLTLPLTANDLDPDGDTLAVTIVSNPAHGTLSPAPGGGFVYMPASGYTGNDAFTYKLSDGLLDSNIASVSLTIAGTSPSHAPVGADKIVSTFEDQAYWFSVNDFSFSDPNDTPPDSLVGVQITSLLTAGSLQVYGINVQAGQLLSPTDMGNLRFVPAPNGNGMLYSTFTFQVKDDGGTVGGGQDVDTTPRTITFNVTPVHDPPVSADHTIATRENTSYTFKVADFPFYEVDSPPANFKAVIITTLPYLGTLTLGGVPVSVGIYIPVSSISSGQLRYTPPLNYNNQSYPYAMPIFTFRVQDDSGIYGGDVSLYSNTMSVSVTSVNQSPLGTSKTLSIIGGASWTFSTGDFGFSDPYDYPYPNSFKSVVVSSSLNPADSTLGMLTDGNAPVVDGQVIPVTDIIGGMLVYRAPTTPTPNNPAFQFKVQDDGGTANGGQDTSLACTMTIDIMPANQPPQGNDISRAIPDDPPYALKVSDFGFRDPNDSPPNNFLAVKIDAPPAQGILNYSGNPVVAGQVIPTGDIAQGLLVFNCGSGGAGPDPFPFADLTFQVQDDGGTANGGADTDPMERTLHFYKYDGPSPPRGADNTVTTPEDQPYAFLAADFKFSDPFDFFPDHFIAVKITTLPATGTLTDGGDPVVAGQLVSVSDFGSGLLQFESPVDANGASYASFTFQVKDDGGTATGASDLDPTPRAMTINVALVNNPPSFSKGRDQNATDENGAQLVAGWATSISAGPHDERAQQLHFAILANTDPTLFASPPAIDSSGMLTFTPAANVSGSAQVTIVLMDDGGTADGGVDMSVPQTFTISVAKPHPWHNVLNPLDATNDNHVVADDALVVINYINSFGSVTLQPNANIGQPFGFLDTNGDNDVSPSDALKVINAVNAGTGGEGEAFQRVFEAPNETGQALNDLLSLLAFDIASQAQRRR